MEIDSKRERLKQLKKEIEAMISDAWLFPIDPRVPKVQGFLGPGPIMFVGERPSTGRFGGPSDERLYNLLVELEMEDSHLTDVIKSRGKVGEPYPEEMSPHKEAFDKEIEIIQPCCIITFGQKVFDLLRFSLAGSGIKMYQVHHYAYARRGARAAAAFEKGFREVVGKCRQQRGEG